MKKEQSCYFYASPAYKKVLQFMSEAHRHQTDCGGEWVNGGQPANVGLKKEMKMLLVMHLLSSGSRLLFGLWTRSAT